MPGFIKHAGRTSSGSGLQRATFGSSHEDVERQLEETLNDEIESEARQQLNPRPPAAKSASQTDRPELETRTSNQRFQEAFRKAVAIKKTILHLEDSSQWNREPGIDPKYFDLPDLNTPVVLQAVDFSRDRTSFSVLTNRSLQDHLAAPRPEWAKVRWIHSNGLSWDVIRALALKYDLHPLAIEDLLNKGSHSNRSKCDYYRSHLFVSVAVHKAAESSSEDDNILAPTKSVLTNDTLRRDERQGDSEHHVSFSASPDRVSSENNSDGQDEESAVEGSKTEIASSLAQYTLDLIHAFGTQPRQEAAKRPPPKRLMTHNDVPEEQRRRRRLGKKARQHEAEVHAAEYVVGQLAQDIFVHVHVEQLCIFLTRDGTILSFTQDPGYHGRLSEIFTRIQADASILRQSEDPSFVLQALLDTCGDYALEIVDELRDHLTSLEAKLLSRPDMDDLRDLHTLSSQLVLLRSNITPFYQLLHSLRTQDEAKTVAVLSGYDGGVSTKDQKGRRGYVSREAKVYLSDVSDHVESVLSSLDLFSNLAENLTGFTFNALNYSSSNFLMALSILSVIFLPATFLVGYFGTNFTQFDAIQGSVSYFWKIAIPVTVASVLIFAGQYLLEYAKGLQRDWLRVYRRKMYKYKHS